MRIRLLPILLAVTWGLPAQTYPAPELRSAFDKAVMEDYVRRLFLWGPEIKVAVSDPAPSPVEGLSTVVVTGSMGSISQDEVFYVSKDGQQILRGAVFDIREPLFEKERKLIRTEGQPSFGAPSAPVTLVLYSDFQCPACAHEAQVIRGQLRTQYFEKIRVYFKDLPLDAIHPWARQASIAGRCVYRENAQGFWDYFDWIYAQQAKMTSENLRSQVLEFAGKKGWDTEKLAACIDSRATESEVNASVAEATALRINSTPTMFVNGRRLPGLEWENLKAVIDFELNYKPQRSSASEKCCEVSLPAPAGK